MEKILLVEDKESLARMLEESLREEGFEVERIDRGDRAVDRIASGQRYSLVVTDLRLPAKDGLAVLRQTKESDPECPVIVMTGFGTVEVAVEAMKAGAFDFIQKPIDLEHLLLLVRRSTEYRALRIENLLLRDEFQKRLSLPPIIGSSPAMVEVSKQIQKVAGSDASVLLLGESGTGKELFARAVHQLSSRRERPFVAINCAAIPDTLIENELFGHEKGAYTGASGRQLGKFELAHRGTVFLDEIGELGFGVQSKILRVLEERSFERIGGQSTLQVDVRIVCATNRDLREAVRAGEFREDLFFRINVFPVVIPPLRERKSDIDSLADYFISRFSADAGRRTLRLSEGGRRRLHAYDWPGNVRELENCIERAVILADGDTIEESDLSAGDSPSGDAISTATLDLSGTLEEAVARNTRIIEAAKIADALRETSTKQEAAERLGVSYRTLVARMKEYEMTGKAERVTP